ncbi:MAG: hypothetical protein ACOH15_08060 [Acetobacterium sp.]
MTTLRNKVSAGGLFMKTKVLENKLRTGALFCMILVLFSFFLPFISAKAHVSITGIMDNTLEVITPENDVLSLKLGDFVLQKPIDDIRVFSIPMGDVKIFNQSVLTILRSPIPDKGIIGNAEQVLSSSALNFLIDPKIKEVISKNIAMGDQINIILSDTWNVLQSAKNVVGAVNNMTIQARESMGQVNAAMASIDSYKSTANAVMLAIFCLGLGLFMLLFYKRVPIGMAIGLSSFLFILFLVTGFCVSAFNSQINARILELTGKINSGIVENLRAILAGTLGDMGIFIANFIGSRGNFLSMNFFIQLDIGYWLILLGLGGSMVLTIMMGFQNRKNNRKDKIEEIKGEEKKYQ